MEYTNVVIYWLSTHDMDRSEITNLIEYANDGYKHCAGVYSPDKSVKACIMATNDIDLTAADMETLALRLAGLVAGETTDVYVTLESDHVVKVMNDF